MVSWEERARIEQQLVTRALSQLFTWINAYPDMNASLLEAAMHSLTDEFGAATANLAFEALRSSREEAGQWESLPEPVRARPASAAQVAGSVGWALRTRSDPRSPGESRVQLAGAMKRLVLQPGRETVHEATRVAETRFVRVPGTKACDFCLMLASRGAVYTSESAALVSSGTRGSRPEGLEFHDFCSCRAIEIYHVDELPEINVQLQQEWYEVTWDENGPLPDQAGVWREHILETRPTRTARRPRNDVPLNAARPELTDDDWNHILAGNVDDTRRGGHRFGTGRDDKTEFPRAWDDQKIHDAVEDTLARPQWSQIHGDRSVLRRMVDGVAVEVSFFGTPPRLHAAYPRYGRGVIRNIGGARVAEPTHDELFEQ